MHLQGVWICCYPNLANGPERCVEGENFNIKGCSNGDKQVGKQALGRGGRDGMKKEY